VQVGVTAAVRPNEKFLSQHGILLGQISVTCPCFLDFIRPCMFSMSFEKVHSIDLSHRRHLRGYWAFAYPPLLGGPVTFVPNLVNITFSLDAKFSS